MHQEGPLTVELALAELRRGMDVRLTSLEGQLALLLQRDEHHERQITDQVRLLSEVEDRLTRVEREQVTRGHLETRFRHTVALLSMLAAAASAAVTLWATVLN
ncbi:hypothetical protein ACSNOI_35755 [Actinomadura kijaniata]|uniref:hypothetical protein n=1 Tax=Actinomadura kijaniata TaxID=46161 RepID=UPI003F197BDC